MAPSSGFVRTDGQALLLDGEPFRVVGANNYYLGFAPDSMVESVFELATQMGLNVLRTWAFLDCGPAKPGLIPANANDSVFFHYWDSDTRRPAFNDGPNGLERLDRTIARAEKAGIRLILPLVNYWDDFGGIRQYLNWFGLSAREEFYCNPETKQAYRDYAEHLLVRVNTRTGRQYKDEPAIFAWELANEPRCVGEDGRPLPDGTDTLTGWVEEMSAYLKTIDPNHLVTVGDEGYFRRSQAGRHALYNGSFGVDCERLFGVPTIDFGTCHLYPSFADAGDAVEFGGNWIREHIEAGQRANKPMVIEEYGWKVESSDGGLGNAARDAVFQSWLDQVVQSEGAGALVWMIAALMPDGQRYPDYDHYTVYAAQDVPSILAYSRRYSSDNG